MRNAEQFSRQQDLVPPAKIQQLQVTIIGVGSLGSATANALAMMGVENFTVYDDDVVETHNLAVQFFKHTQVCDPPLKKVVALQKFMQDMHGITINPVSSKFAGENLSGIVVSAVDNMDARKVIWSSVKLNPAIQLYIDTRATGMYADLFPINPVNLKAIRQYEALHIFPQEEGIQGPCTQKMTTFIAWGVGSHVGSLLTQYLNGKDLPFKLTLDMEHNLTSIELLE